jgi:hypothetical protein
MLGTDNQVFANYIILLKNFVYVFPNISKNGGAEIKEK